MAKSFIPLSLPTPVICCLATGEVEASSQRNELSFTDLLSAFSGVQLKTQFRSIGGTYPLSELRVRFIRASELRPRPVPLSERLLESVVRPEPGEATSSGEWYRRYRSLLKESLCCIEESMSECPSVVMLAVSTSDTEPLACFEQLEQHFMPETFTTGQFDPSASTRLYLLVHDRALGAQGKTNDPELIFRQMKQRFRTANCYMLNLNSLGDGSLNLAAPDVWGNSLMTTFFPDQIPQHAPAAAARGCCLSADDMLAIRDLVHQVVMKDVVPAMEKRIMTLNATVSSTRKGMKNVIKSWWRKPRDAEDRSSSGVEYRYDQIESQILLLADSTFVMKDYDTALSMYRMVRDDFKADKALLHMGCCHVMIALCLAMLEGEGRSARRESETALRDACVAFQTAFQSAGGHRRKEVTLATRLATHASLLRADILGHHSLRHPEAAEILVRASRDESDLSSAVLLEQAAWHFRGGKLLRKFAFHIIRAGIKYQNAGQEEHAVRCFTASKEVYQDSRWVHIQDYVQAHLAKHLTQLGRYSMALTCYLDIVSAGRQSPDRQGRFIREFLDLCVARPEGLLEVAKALEDPTGGHLEGCSLGTLNIPCILEDKLEVYESQNAGAPGYSASRLAATESKAWMAVALQVEAELNVAKLGGATSALLEECVKAAVESSDTFSRQSEKAGFCRQAVQSVRVLGSSTAVNPRALAEPIAVGVVFQNPLDITIQVTDVQLVVSLATAGEALPGVEDKRSTSLERKAFDELTAGLLDPSGHCNIAKIVEENGVLLIDSHQITLDPREQTEIAMKVCPLVSGRLKILGLKWRLQEKVWCHHKFQLPGILLHDTLEHRANRTRAPNESLDFDVHEDLPWLSLQVDGIPDTMLQGEIVEATMTIKNHGRASTADIVLKSNMPWLYVGERPAIGEGNKDFESTPASTLVGTSGTLMRIDLGRRSSLAPGEVLHVPIWIRGVGGGKQTLKLLLHYTRSGVDGAPLRFVRYVRYKCEVCVLPSMHVFATIAPTSHELGGEYILSVILTNFRADSEEIVDRDILVNHVCSMSNSWKIEPLAPPPSGTAFEGAAVRLRHQESLVLSFRVIRVAEPRRDICLSAWNLGPESLGISHSSNGDLRSALACMCLDDMAATFERESMRLQRMRFASQNMDNAPRSVSSVRRERAAGVAHARDGNMQPVNSNRHPGSAAGLCGRYPHDLAVVVTWNTDGKERLVTGHHQFVGVHVCPQQSLNVSKDCALAMDIHLPAMVHHNFGSGDCVVPVTVRVSNQFFEGVGQSLNFVLEASESRGSAVRWLGAVQQSVNGLAPTDSVDICFCASISAPGVFDLNNFGIRMHGSDKIYTFPIQAIVSVCEK